ncbi:hypothetical protein ANN_19966 [Periplaneta americana]|uniref:Tc1-like transposase DDE domain-containing protein n=1 Tax=Periplaneta americana TaxID=6978 RepID=A0ABQ8SBB5_PERAM|nr:hypothetical protein ANN_19966 [Periplaneta americana]
MHNIREEETPRPIIYIDETWVNHNHSRKYIWTDSSSSGGLKVPIKVPRLIVCHAGSSNYGFIEGAKMVFQASNNGDYHQQMNSDVFKEWFIDLLRSLEESCVIVMDNASYHSRVFEKIPTTNSRKSEIVSWLASKEIPHDPQKSVPELLQIVDKYKGLFPKVYELDNIAAEMGHEVVRLPPYHCQYNPIELIWATVKGEVAEKNKTFKIKDVRMLLEEALDRDDKLNKGNDENELEDKLVKDYFDEKLNEVELDADYDDKLDEDYDNELDENYDKLDQDYNDKFDEDYDNELDENYDKLDQDYNDKFDEDYDNELDENYDKLDQDYNDKFDEDYDNELDENYDKLDQDYNDKFDEDYDNELDENYDKLDADYDDKLDEDYDNELDENYDKLDQDYNKFDEDYHELDEDYDKFDEYDDKRDETMVTSMETIVTTPAAYEVRSVIKFLNAQGIAPIEIDRQLCQVYGPNVMSKQMQQRIICLPIDLAQLTINFNRRYALCIQKLYH